MLLLGGPVARRFAGLDQAEGLLDGLDAGAGDAGGGGNLGTGLAGRQELLHLCAGFLRNAGPPAAVGGTERENESVHVSETELGGQGGEALPALRRDLHFKLGHLGLGRLKFLEVLGQQLIGNWI